MDMDTIFCYTGTGNTLASAKILAHELNMQVVLISDELQNSIVAGERCIIMFPVYAYGMPKTVRRFIKTSAFNVGYMAVVTTYGSSSGGAYAESIRLLKKRKQRVDLTVGIKSVENYVHMFGWTKEEQIAKIVEEQNNITMRIADMVKTNTKNKRMLFRPFSCFVSAVFRGAINLFERRYKVLPTCTGCGFCEKVCPARAIQMKDERPAFVPKQCDHCQACMQLCPSRAIKFGKVKPDGRRYQHPDVESSDLTKR